MDNLFVSLSIAILPVVLSIVIAKLYVIFMKNKSKKAQEEVRFPIYIEKEKIILYQKNMETEYTDNHSFRNADSTYFEELIRGCNSLNEQKNGSLLSKLGGMFQ